MDTFLAEKIITSLYLYYFNRMPDTAGLQNYVGKLLLENDIERISSIFENSTENVRGGEKYRLPFTIQLKNQIRKDSKVVFATLINQEFDLLDLQIRLLDNYVDKFYVIESHTTFTGIPKSDFLYKYAIFSNPKVEHLMIENNMEWQNSTPWERENMTRRILWDYIVQQEDAESIVLFVDVDEIINPNKIDEIIAAVNEYGVIGLEMSPSMYFLNSLAEDLWTKPRALLLSENVHIENLRNNAVDLLVPNAGIHLSYFISQGIQEKISSYSHTEYNVLTPISNQFYELCIKYGVDTGGNFFLSRTNHKEISPTSLPLLDESRIELESKISGILPNGLSPTDWLVQIDLKKRALVKAWAMIRLQVPAELAYEIDIDFLRLIKLNGDD